MTWRATRAELSRLAVVMLTVTLGVLFGARAGAPGGLSWPRCVALAVFVCFAEAYVVSSTRRQIADEEHDRIGCFCPDGRSAGSYCKCRLRGQR